MKHRNPFNSVLEVVVYALLAAASAEGDASAQQNASAGHPRGAVYALTNDPRGNRILIFHRDFNGQLFAAGSVATGGRGTGEGLGSQGSLILSPDGRQLFAVNAGSNQISSHSIRGMRPILVDVVDSGGQKPISLTLDGERLFALNAGGAQNVTGFAVDRDGRLSPLDDSTRPLSSDSDVGPAQVQFKPDGSALIVTEKDTNNIDSFTFGSDGMLSNAVITRSHGETPFGFAFNGLDELIVSEAFGGAKGRSAASSYALSTDDIPIIVSGSVPNGQSASCWTVVTGNGRFAYVSNTGNGTISGYSIDRCGALNLLEGGISAVTGEGTGPTEMAFSTGSRYLYVLGPPVGKIFGYAVDLRTGSLHPVAEVDQLPLGAVGLAAR